jgi:hypothetical protein
MKLWLFFAMTLCAFAQIERPQIGVMLDEKGDARPVSGVAASATVGDPILTGVVSLNCSAQICLAKTETSLLSSAGESVDAPAGPAIFAAPYIYFPAARQLVQWHDGQLDPIDFTPDGAVISLRRNGDGLDYAIRRDGETWIEHYSFLDQGAVLLGSLGPAKAVLLVDAGTLIADEDQVRLVRADGSETAFDVAGVQGFVAMSDSSIELVTLQSRWILQVNEDRALLLPGAPE